MVVGTNGAGCPHTGTGGSCKYKIFFWTRCLHRRNRRVCEANRAVVMAGKVLIKAYPSKEVTSKEGEDGRDGVSNEGSVTSNGTGSSLSEDDVECLVKAVVCTSKEPTCRNRSPAADSLRQNRA
ncbi:hypothetical protein L7F22_011586 [Adiantum nelumboides]|nr:hypothetical protein [Adiantum nelumboides]